MGYYICKKFLTSELQLKPTNEWFNEQALAIWKRHSSNNKLVPLLLPHIENNVDLLLVGMNPSHRVNWITKKIKNNPQIFGNETCESLMTWTGDIDESKIKMIIALEQIARDEDNQYYKQLNNFAKSCGAQNWAHTDTFLIRNTNQKQMLHDVFNEKDLNQFGLEQIDLFKQMIDRVKPKKLVVLNASASNIFNQYIANSKTNLAMLKMGSTEVYFAGMLSGQRCMDRYSQLRLIESLKNTSNKYVNKYQTL